MKEKEIEKKAKGRSEQRVRENEILKENTGYTVWDGNGSIIENRGASNYEKD